MMTQIHQIYKIILLISFLAACEAARDREGDSYINEIYLERYTSDYRYVAILQTKEKVDTNWSCLMTLQLYETSLDFREMVLSKYETGELIPHVYYSSANDDFELNLTEMNLLRDITFHDKLRSYPCPDWADGHEPMFVRWVEGVSEIYPELGALAYERSDTAFSMSIRGENHMYFLW
jgi:hypothetical protein